ncbi:MAG: ATP-dependent protease subunit HslV [Holosporales bacterium]|jgi:ATP-dependent HslUV protease subunit HslV|nr:ATP-dependent protease subunit HslV [Holosporales bacterium]
MNTDTTTPQLHGTTIISVRRFNKVVIAGDGQVTFGDKIVMKATAKKVRRIGKDNVIVGFAGVTADAFALLERLEGNLEKYSGQLTRACVELTKDCRMDKYLRKLEAMLIVADANVSLIVTGTGDVLESDDQILAIGSGGTFATAAAKALLENTDFDSEKIALTSLKIAGDLCIFTNNNINIESIEY